MVLSTYAEAKNAIVFGIELEGALEQEAMKVALAIAVTKFPQFLCRVEPTGSFFGKRLVWASDPEVQSELIVSGLDTADTSDSLQDALLRHLDDSLHKEWDLLKTVPTEFHLISLAEDRHCFILLVHHAAADAWTLSQFIRELLGCYQETVTGEKPTWAEQPGRASRLRRRVANPKRSFLRDLLFVARLAANARLRKQPFRKVRSNLGTCEEHHTRAKLSCDETERIQRIASEANVPTLDLLVAATNRAMDKWNASHDMPAGTITTAITVQMRNRYGPRNAPVNSSAIYLRSRSGERTDPAEFVRLTAGRRTRELRSRSDVRAAQASRTLADAVRFLPLSARKKTMYSFLKRPLFSLLITFLERGWPEFGSRRLSGDTYLEAELCGMEVTDLYAVGHRLAIRTPLRVWGIMFRNRLHLLLTASGNHFSRSDAEVLTDLVAETLLENPFENAS